MDARWVLPTRSESHCDRHSRLPLLLGLVASAELGFGLFTMCQHRSVGTRIPLETTSAIILFFVAGVQFRIAWHRWQCRAGWHPVEPIRKRLFWRWLLAGFVAAYAICLLFFQPASGPYVFAALLALWSLIAQFSLIATPPAVKRLLQMLSNRRLRRAGWILYFLLILPLAAELALRIYALVADNPIRLAYMVDRLKLVPGADYTGCLANRHGYRDREFLEKAAPGTFRVVAIGDDLTQYGDAQTNFLSLLEARLPGSEIYNLGLPSASPRDYAAQAARELDRFRPDLVLAFISIGDDITEEVPLPGPFDYRSLQIVQLGFSCIPAETQFSPFQTEPQRDHQAYLRRSAAQLSVCRTPISPELHARWNRALHHMDQLIERCQASGFAVAIVVSPVEYQVNPTLFQTLCRRDGCQTEQLDLHLPQRRLAAYAQEKKVPMVDLLPHLRACQPAAFERNRSSYSRSGNIAVADGLGHWLRMQYSSLIATSSAERVSVR